MSAIPATRPATGEFLGHPPALFMLFFAELWERFSFYGMRALLTLYMVNQLQFADAKAAHVYGAYGALVYATPVIGGLLADRVLGYRRAIILGGVLMAIGHFVMAIENLTMFYAALAFLIVGNGFFKPNISSLVGKLYAQDDPRRDGAFTIFYMGINLGAWFAPLVCGIVGERIGWHYGFGLAGVGMVIGLVVFTAFQRLLGEHGFAPAERPQPAGLDSGFLVLGGAVLAVPLFWWLVQRHDVLGYALVALGVVVFGGLAVRAFLSGAIERDRLFVVITLIFFSILFWAFFEQAGSSINLFTDRNVDTTMFGWKIPTSTFQSVNPFFVVTLGPLFAAAWTWMARNGMEPSTPLKFALGILQIGLGFGCLVIGARLAGTDAMTSVWFLILGYLLHTTGELCTSPVGLSMVTKLSPPKMVGLVMGAWFLSSAYAHYIASIIAALTGTSEGQATAIHDAHTTAGDLAAQLGGTGSAALTVASGTGSGLGSIVGQANLPAVVSLPLYESVFLQIALVSSIAAVLCFVLVPLLRRGMHGVN